VCGWFCLVLKQAYTNLPKNDNEAITKKGRHFTREKKHQINLAMMANGYSKREIWEKYTDQVEEHGQILRWMKKLGYPTKEKPLSVTFERKEIQIPEKKMEYKLV
jgi:hypothetical protein